MKFIGWIGAPLGATHLRFLGTEPLFYRLYKYPSGKAVAMSCTNDTLALIPEEQYQKIKGDLYRVVPTIPVYEVHRLTKIPKHRIPEVELVDGNSGAAWRVDYAENGYTLLAWSTASACWVGATTQSLEVLLDSPSVYYVDHRSKTFLQKFLQLVF